MRRYRFEIFDDSGVARYDRDTQVKRMQLALQEACTPLQREAIMRVVSGESMKEIADSRGVNKSTVCRTVHRGIARLRYVLKY